jgi:hypothetical protein
LCSLYSITVLNEVLKVACFSDRCRSMAQYAGICKEGDTNKGLIAAARDATTINALQVVSCSIACFHRY